MDPENEIILHDLGVRYQCSVISSSLPVFEFNSFDLTHTMKIRIVVLQSAELSVLRCQWHLGCHTPVP